MSKQIVFLGLVSAVFLLVLTGPASAQSIWIDRGVDRALWLEVQKPNFSKEYLTNGGFFSPPLKSTIATSAVFLSTRWRVSGPLVLRAEIPFINVGFKDQTVYVLGVPQPYNGATESQFGNPLVGVEVGGPVFPLSGEFGVRFPVVDDEHFFSSEVGSYIDFDRFEAFSSHLWTFTAVANLQYKGPSGLLLRFRTGPALFVPTESGSDAELFADYSAQAGYHFRKLSLLGGLTGRAWLTESNLTNRFIDQFGFAASYAFGNFIPGVHLRFPLDGTLNDYLDFVFGINIGYRLP